MYHRQFPVVVTPGREQHVCYSPDFNITRTGTDIPAMTQQMAWDMREEIMKRGMPPEEAVAQIGWVSVKWSEGGTESKMGAIDPIGAEASRFLNALYSADQLTVWDTLSSESKGAWLGKMAVVFQKDLASLRLASRVPESGDFVESIISPLFGEILSLFGFTADMARDEIQVYPSVYITPNEARAHCANVQPNEKLVGRLGREWDIPMVRENSLWKVDYLSLLTPAPLLG